MCADVEPMHNHTFDRAENILRDAIEDKTGKAMTIVGFNDHPTTTHAEVLAMLDAASERALSAAGTVPVALAYATEEEAREAARPYGGCR